MDTGVRMSSFSNALFYVKSREGTWHRVEKSHNGWRRAVMAPLD
uniref:Uncharacterized protein n=1 Tax=Anguilla anguilla TaxID=7936 RepID=A0A0E9UWP3_ANGAN